MPATLYTLGYEKRSLAELIALLGTHRIGVLIDVRETAWSHKPGFSSRSLDRELADAGITYCHAAFAGNPKWLRSEAATQAECLRWYEWYLDEFPEVIEVFDPLVASYQTEKKRVCIMCFERHPDDCHRSILAARWQERGKRLVEHW